MDNLPNNEQTPEKTATGSKNKARIADFKASLNIPTMSKAIRRNCLECCGGLAKEVKYCQVQTCHLFPYRFGRSPKTMDDLKKTVFDNKGNVIGEKNFG